MEKNNDILNQFKNAAEQSELRSHLVNEAVWDKIDAKLNTTVLQKKNKIWKRLAIAASLLFFMSMTVIFLQKVNPKTEFENAMVATDTITKIIITNEKVALEEKDKTKSDEIIFRNKNIQPNATKILEKAMQTETDNAVVVSESKETQGYFETEERSNLIDNSKRKTHFATPKFEARSVTAAPIQSDATADVVQVKAKPEPPLLILDNKAITGKSGDKYKNLSDSKMDAIGKENLEEVVYLAKPLYIINGVQYTEEEMYGENPTSPYAPLSEQEIVNTVVLRGKEATKAFGKKGENGVLIITTKNGKPKPKGK